MDEISYKFKNDRIGSLIKLTVLFQSCSQAMLQLTWDRIFQTLVPLLPMRNQSFQLYDFKTGQLD